MTWTLSSFRIHLEDGPDDKDDGMRHGIISDIFAIHEVRGGYRLTHLHSGMRIQDYDSQPAAKSAASRLGTLQGKVVDWYSPNPTLSLTSEQRSPIRELL